MPLNNAIPRFTRPLLFLLFFVSVLVRAESAGQQPLLVHSERDFPPYTTVDANGQPTGFAVELLKAVAGAEGLGLELGVKPWNESLRSLENGDIDLITTMVQTAEREQKFLFSDTYMHAYDAIFVRRGDYSIASQADVLNHKVIVVRDYYMHEYLRGLHVDDRLIVAGSVTEGMARLAAGEGEAMVMARLTGLQTIRELAIDNVEALENPVDWYSLNYSFAVSKHRPELQASLNRGLAKVRADGTYDKLFDKWIASADEVAIKNAKVSRNFNIILAAFGVLFVSALMFIYLLRRMVSIKTAALLAESEKRYQVEKVVDQNERFFLGAFESTLQGMALLSTDGVWVRVNKALSNLQGTAPADIIGTNIVERLNEHDKRLYNASVQSMLTGKQESFAMEFQCLSNKAGKWVRAFFYLVKSDEGKSPFIFAQIQDISEKRSDEEKLKALLNDLQFLQSTINRHAIVSRADAKGIITYVNESFCTVSGYSFDELIGSDHKLVKSGVHNKGFYKDLWETITSGGVWQGEICNRGKDGSLYWVATTIVPHMETEGEPDYYLSVRTDITKQKKAESRIRSESEFLHTTLENIKDGIVVLDDSGKVKLVNAAARNYVVNDQGGLECQSSDETSLMPCKLNRIINDTLVGTTLDEIPMTLSSVDKGDEHNFLINSHPIKDKNGSQVGCLVSMHDVTERLSTEKQLVDSNFRFKAFFDNNAIAICTFDNNYSLLNVNAAFEAMLGYSEAELQTLGIKGITHPDDLPASYAKYQDFVNGKVDNYQLEKRYLHKDGSSVWGRLTTFYVKAGEDKDKYMVGMVADITHEKFMQEDRIRLQRQLRQAEKMEAIGALTGGIAHDFNNILASIMGYTDLALMKFCQEPDTKLKQYLTEVYKAGERARNLIAQMMDFSRAGGGSRSNLAMETIVKETLKMMAPTLPSSIQVEYQGHEKNLPQISIDPVRLHQVVMNLIINARDALDGKGKIVISIKAYKGSSTECLSCHDVIDGDYVELCVSDFGVGMAPAELVRIFDPFYTTKDVGKGTGMGLSVIHGIVHEYDGHIIVESEAGKGSDFRILFNALAPLESVIEEQSEDAEVLPHEFKRVMVVDDEPMITEYLKELLESVGHHASVYTSSKEALAAFNNAPDYFDVVITDQTMPDILGDELIAAMKAVRPELPVILCTGYTASNIKEVLEGFELVQFLEKPVKRQELLAMVNPVVVH